MDTKGERREKKRSSDNRRSINLILEIIKKNPNSLNPKGVKINLSPIPDIGLWENRRNILVNSCTFFYKCFL
jgi:hypothetical protein